MRYLLIIFSLFFWSCSEGGNPLSSDQIQIPEMSDICENILSDVDGSLVSCDESCGLFSENCYHLYDLQVLEDIVFMNDTLDLSLLDVGNQGWTDGRLTTLDLSNLELIALPESICNLNSVISVDNNNLCPPYQFECIDDIGTQNISGCANFTDYSGQSYYDFDINVLTEIKNLNPILSDILLLDIGYQQWYNGRLSSINLSNLELIALPESICTLNAITNVDNNQLCQEFQYECIDQGEWGIQSGLESMDDCGICGGNNEDIDVCGRCFGDATDPENCNNLIGNWEYVNYEYYDNPTCDGDPYFISEPYPDNYYGLEFYRRYITFSADSFFYGASYCPTYDGEGWDEECHTAIHQSGQYLVIDDGNPITGQFFTLDYGFWPFEVYFEDGQKILAWYESGIYDYVYEEWWNYPYNSCIKGIKKESNVSMEVDSSASRNKNKHPFNSNFINPSIYHENKNK